MGDLDQVLLKIDADLGTPDEWKAWPGGWQDDIESALIDAVFSARAVYKTKHGKGVYYQVTAWQQGRRSRRRQYTLRSLVDEIRGSGVDEWATNVIRNTQRSPRRPATAAEGPTKAAAVLEAAKRLLSLDPPIDSASDVEEANVAAVRSALMQVDGIGYATANYFTMLLGHPGVKPDRMIHRFLRDALGRDLNDAQAAQLIKNAAVHLKQTEHALDHAIWHWESQRATAR